jgi:sugar lactone lactonase YvrE
MKRLISAMVIAACVIIPAGCDDDPEAAARKQAGSGDIVTIAGKAGNLDYKGDGGSALEATLGWVIDLSLDDSGNLYMADGAANVIRKIDKGYISTVAGKFRGFNQPYNDISPDGTSALDAILEGTFLVDVDASGNIYFSEMLRSILRVVSDGTVKTVAGNTATTEFESEGSPATETGMWGPQGLAVDRSTGAIYYSDTQNNAVRKIYNGTVTTVAGRGREEAGFTGDGGPAVEARLNFPKGITIDALGNLYISDAGNHVIRKVSNGIITTIAGTGVPGYSGDGGPATDAEFFGAQGIAVDKDGNVYFADVNKSVIRKITVSTGIISTVAGNGTAGFSGDNGPATEAQLYDPWDVAVDAEGNIYIADSGNAVIRMVRK